MTDLEPAFVGRFLTRAQVDTFRRAIADLLWPNESLEITPMGEHLGEETFKIMVLRRPYEGEYPVDMEASVLYYRVESQLHLEMFPSAFLWQALWASFRNPQILSPEEFKASPFFSRSSFESISKRVDEHLPLDSVFLDLELRQGRWEVVGHEGRHRAMVAHERRMKKVPVILFIRVEGDLMPLYDLDETQIRDLREIALRWKAQSVGKYKSSDGHPPAMRAEEINRAIEGQLGQAKVIVTPDWPGLLYHVGVVRDRMDVLEDAGVKQDFHESWSLVSNVERHVEDMEEALLGTAPMVLGQEKGNFWVVAKSIRGLWDLAEGAMDKEEALRKGQRIAELNPGKEVFVLEVVKGFLERPK